MRKLLAAICGLALALALQSNAAAQVAVTPLTNVVNNASTATFTATFAVPPTNAVSYQWQFDGNPLAGETNSTLTLEDVSTNQAGSYTVVVNTSLTSSPPATLTIVPGTIVTFIFSGFIGGGTSNVDVQLFDHDKPATVENFLHYISSGAFQSNMFFQRCVPGYILQGGSYGATDQTNTNSPISGWAISTEFTNVNPPFPPQVDSEFGVGPLIHNRFGTLAMALNQNATNSASDGFFFNLTDNSSNIYGLDGQGFTVFGRILDGTNVLQYFNGLTNGDGIFTGETFLPSAYMELPVNYDATNDPADANLVFCDFLYTNLPVDTIPPTAAITSPANGTVTTNYFPSAAGTAADNVAVAVVITELIPQPGEDGTYPNEGVGFTNYAIGMTNWSVNFNNPNDSYGLVWPGKYNLVVQSQDGAGNLSAPLTNSLTVTAVQVIGNGTVNSTNSTATNNGVGYPFQINSQYYLLAAPNPGQVFLNWIYEGNVISVVPPLSFPMEEGRIFTATFISNTLPGTVAFISPVANELVVGSNLVIRGTISNVAATPVTVAVKIYSTDNYAEVGPPLTNIGATNWSVTVTNLPPDTYDVQAIATDTNGNTTVITEPFTVSTPDSLTLNITGPGTVVGATNGEIIADGENFTVTAIPDPGAAFLFWTSPDWSSNTPVITPEMSSALTLEAAFVTNNDTNLIAFAFPPANGVVGTNPFNVTGTFTSQQRGQASINCYIFSNGLALAQLPAPTGAATWTTTAPTLSPGSYSLVAAASDGVANGELIQENFTAQPTAPLKLVVVGNGKVSGATNGQILILGNNFTVTAVPGPGQAFYTWNNGTNISNNATETNTMEFGLTLTATFVPSNTAKGIAITYPPRNAMLTVNNFTARGTIAPSFKPAEITCQVFLTNGPAVGPPLTTSGKGTWSVPVTNLGGGYYTLEVWATNALGESTLVSENFAVSAFAAAAGTYSGLFVNSASNGPVAPTNSGFIRITVTPSGRFSGGLFFPAYGTIPIYSYPFANENFAYGYTQFAIPDFHGSELGASIYLDLSIGGGIAYGTVAAGTWSSQLNLYRSTNNLSTNTIPAVGKYIFSLQAGGQTNAPSTNGYASVIVNKNGSLAVAGVLPDNTTFSQSALVSPYGYWPIYAIPSGLGGRGMIMGWETFSNASTSGGQLYWSKPPNIGAYFTGGIGVASNAPINAPGTNFIRPAGGTFYSMVFTGAPISPPVTNIVTVSTAGQFVAAGDPADKLKVSLSANGVITGSILNAHDGKMVQFKGAFMGPSQGGSGFVTDIDGQTGRFILSPVPQ